MDEAIKAFLVIHRKKKKEESASAKRLTIKVKNKRKKVKLRRQSESKKKQHDLLRQVQEHTLEEIANLAAKENLSPHSGWLDYKVLKCAIKSKRGDIVKFLLDHGCRVNKPTCQADRYNPFVVNCLSPLHDAVQAGDEGIIVDLLSKGASYDAVDNRGNTPLHQAFFSKKFRVVDLLLSLSPKYGNPNPANEIGLTHMHIACACNNALAVRTFLEAGISVNHFVSFQSPIWPGYTALHFAVECCSAEVVRILVEASANENAMNAEGVCPSDLGRKLRGETSLVDSIFLREEQRIKPTGAKLLSAFQSACLSGSCASVLEFLRNGASVDEPVDARDPAFALCTPLHLAVQSGDREKVRLLLHYNACVDLRNCERMNPLHLALYTENPEKVSDQINSIVGLLYPKLAFKWKNQMDVNGLSFLHIACSQNDVELTRRILMDSTEDVNSQVLCNMKNFSLFSPLHFAVLYHAKETLELLLRKGAIVNLSDNFTYGTPLLLALEVASDIEIIDLLLAHGARLNAVRPFDNRSALHLLIGLMCAKKVSIAKKLRIEKLRRKILDLIDLFCSGGCDVNARDSDNNTPLHYACKSKKVDNAVIMKLLNYGADVDLMNNNAKSPLALASRSHFKVLCKHLERLRVANLIVSSYSLAHYNRMFCRLNKLEKLSVVDYRNDCEAEKELLENIHVDRDTSVLNLLRIEEPRRMARYCQRDGIFDRFVHDVHLNTMFNRFGPLLRLQYNKGANARSDDDDDEMDEEVRYSQESRKRKRESSDDEGVEEDEDDYF